MAQINKKYKQLKEHNGMYYFTLEGLINTNVITVTSHYWIPQRTESSPADILTAFNLYLTLSAGRDNFFTFNMIDKSNSTLIASAIGQDFFLKLFEKYGQSYTISIDKIYEYSIVGLDENGETFAALHDQVRSGVVFLNRIIQKFGVTYPKYSTLLSIYDTEASNLMDGINNSYTDTRSESTTGSSSGNNRLNDTPQDSGTFTDDEHTSSYSENASEAQSSLTSTFTHTQSDEVEILIDRLDKVQTKYQNLMQKWVDEFKDMFIMPVALDCEVNLNE